MLWEVALFPYANITILFGSAMKNLKNLASHMRLFYAHNKNHATTRALANFSHHSKNYANLPELYPIFIRLTPGMGQPLPAPRTTCPTYM